MSERVFYRMLALSVAFHILFLVLVSLTVKRANRAINPFFPSYSVNLVDDVVGGGTQEGLRPLSGPPPQRAPQREKQKPVTKKAKPAEKPREPRETVRSLAPKRLPAKETTGTTKDELRRLEERIKEMRRRTAASEPQGETRRTHGTGVGGEGLSGGGGGSGTEQNAALVRYLVGLRERIENAWHIPFISGAKKDLEAKVTVKIRRDGRIFDITVEKRSGNRAYDESVLRVLRAIDPLPPIPPSVEDPLEVEMTLRPEGVS